MLRWQGLSAQALQVLRLNSMLPLEFIKLIAALAPFGLKAYQAIRQRSRAARLDTALSKGDAAAITKILNERF